MKIRLWNIAIIFLLFNTSCSFAQGKYLTNDMMASRIRSGIRKNYHPDSVSLSKLCKRACIFIKFRVNRQGRIANLAFSKDSSTFIIETLGKAVYSLQNDAQLIKTLKRSGKTIILPFAYSYQLACDVGIDQENREKFLGSYLKMVIKREGAIYSVYDMLTFDDKPLNAVDCVLLNPLSDSAQKTY